MKLFEESKSFDKSSCKISYQRIPLYIDVILPKLLMSEKSPCFPKIYQKSAIEPFPIIIIHNSEFYKLFIDFLQTNCIYKEFNSFQVLKNKLILSIEDLNLEYDANHLTKNMNIFKFADITNSLEYPIYNQQDKEDIIKTIKAGLNGEEKNSYPKWSGTNNIYNSFLKTKDFINNFNTGTVFGATYTQLLDNEFSFITHIYNLRTIEIKR